MKKPTPSIDHHQAIVRELKQDLQLAREYLRAAMEDVDNPDVLRIAILHLADAGYCVRGRDVVVPDRDG